MLLNITCISSSCKVLALKDPKARLHRRFLSRQLDAIFVAPKLHQALNMFETPAILPRQIALKIAPGLHVRSLSATKIASSCCYKNRLCKRALTQGARRAGIVIYRHHQSRSQSFVPLDRRSENESSGSIHFGHAL